MKSYVSTRKNWQAEAYVILKIFYTPGTNCVRIFSIWLIVCKYNCLPFFVTQWYKTFFFSFIRVVIVISTSLPCQPGFKSSGLPGGGINVFASILHTHIAGTLITVEF